MIRTIRLKDLLPDYYEGIAEMEALLTVEQYQIDEFAEALDAANNNLFVMIADSEGLSVWETLLGITPVQDLDARRMAVIMKLLPPRPITIKYLREIIDLLNINAELVVNGAAFHVYVIAHTTASDATDRLNRLLAHYLPANLTYTAMNVGKTSTVGQVNIGTGRALGVKIRNRGGDNGE